MLSDVRRGLEQLQVLVHRRPAQPAHPRQLGHIEPPRSIGRVVPVKHGRNVILCGWPPADFLALRLGVSHAAFDPRPDDGQLQFGKDGAHLDKGLAHGIDLPVPAIDGDAPDDDEAEVLALHQFDDLTELLGASAQAADLGADERIALLGSSQQKVEVLLDSAVAVLAFGDDFLRACRFELAHLSVEVLPLFFCEGAACISVNHGCLRKFKRLFSLTIFFAQKQYEINQFSSLRARVFVKTMDLTFSLTARL